jgi:hypothetical protein
VLLLPQQSLLHPMQLPCQKPHLLLLLLSCCY